MAAVFCVAVPAAAAPSPGVERSFEALKRDHPRLAVAVGARPAVEVVSGGLAISVPSGQPMQRAGEQATPPTVKRQGGDIARTQDGRSRNTAVAVKQGGAGVLVEGTANGVRLIEEFATRSPSHRVRYEVLRNGKRADYLVQADGRVLVGNGDAKDFTAFAGVDAPWAYDSKGRPVPAHYEAEGGVLNLVVTPDASTAYPVLADPSYTFWAGEVHCSWGSCTFYLERVKTYWIADMFASLPFALAATLVAGSLCGWLAAAAWFSGIGAWVVGAACELWATWYAWEIQDKASAGWVCLTVKKYHWNSYPEAPGNASGYNDHCNYDS